MDLTEFLGTNYKNYHFSENLDKSGLNFDYKIKFRTTACRNELLFEIMWAIRQTLWPVPKDG